MFCAVAPSFEKGIPGVHLGFRPLSGRALPPRIDDRAPLDPELDLATVHGLGKVLRLLRAARLAAPDDPRLLLGRAWETSRRLERALGTAVLLHLRSRTRVRFRAWTDAGIEEVEDAAEVVEEAGAWWVTRRSGGLPLHLPRDSVVRSSTDRERWFQVIHIEREEPGPIGGT